VLDTIRGTDNIFLTQTEYLSSLYQCGTSNKAANARLLQIINKAEINALYLSFLYHANTRLHDIENDKDNKMF